MFDTVCLHLSRIPPPLQQSITARRADFVTLHAFDRISAAPSHSVHAHDGGERFNENKSEHTRAAVELLSRYLSVIRCQCTLLPADSWYSCFSLSSVTHVTMFQLPIRAKLGMKPL